MQIKEAALAGKFDVLLVFMFDRLGRRDDETPFVVQWFVSHGIQVWSVKEGEQRFDTHVDKLMNYIRFWQASGESEKTSIRVRTRQQQMVLAGEYRGGLIPYGFDAVYLGRVNKKGQPVRDLVIDVYT
jgi:DNA invertase Pin-like site-specific DNA recombinase